MIRKLPKTASVAHAGEGSKLVAPSASRNADDIAAMLAQFVPDSGNALEIASGTGQHSIVFASKFPTLHWQPTDIDPARRASIDAYVGESGRPNIAPAQHLDACKAGWSVQNGGQSLIVVINLLHLISMAEVCTLISEAAVALAPAGRLVVYGPFKRGGELISEADQTFHASLTGQNSDIGYKDDFDILDTLQDAGLGIVDIIEMPSNNLAFIVEKPTV